MPENFQQDFHSIILQLLNLKNLEMRFLNLIFESV